MTHQIPRKSFKLALLSAAAVIAGSALPISVMAADTPTLEERVKEQQSEIDTLKKQVEALTSALRGGAPKVANSNNVDSDTPTAGQDNAGQSAKVSFNKGSPTFTTGDGQFSASLHSLVQFDNAWYNQDKAPAGTQLSNGSNFRRAQVGIAGTAFQDWSYNITLDFGGSATEKPGYIYYAYAQYNGLKPFGFRIGASTPPLTLDDATGSGDLVFLERAAAVDVARNIGGGPSRDAFTVFAQGNRYLAAVSFTGGKVGDSAVFDEQQALLGRAAYLAYDNNDAKILLDAGGTRVLKLAGTVAGQNPPTSISFSDTPELTVDSTGAKLVSTTNFDASHVSQWDVGAAATWRSLSAQGGYFGYSVERRASALANPNFNGWYAQATWALTGETRPYDPATASFRNPVPNKPLGANGGLGAWELAARYSVLDLNFDAGNPGTIQAADAVRGGRQNIWTVGLNWYPNAIFHVALDYQFIDVKRLGATGNDLGAKADAVAIRTQFAF